MLNSKQLHVHSVPLIVFSAMSLIAVMALGLSAMPMQPNMRAALTRPALKFGTSNQSMVAVQPNSSESDTESQVVDNNRTRLSGLSSTGERMASQLSTPKLFMQ